jgi:hypothetical protein
MSRLAQAGLSSTASPLCAWAKHQGTAASSVAWRWKGTPVPASMASMASASRPIVATARAWRATGPASGPKSWPLPSPPRMTTSLPWRSAPRPSSAATVAPTLVPLLSSKASTPPTTPTDSTRCGSPRYSRRPCSIGASGQPMAVASASAASALAALWRPRMRSASAGIRRCRMISSGSSLRRLIVSSAGMARTSQAMPPSTTRPKSPGCCGGFRPKRQTWRLTAFLGRPRPGLTITGAGTMASTSGSSRLITITACWPKMRALAAA